MSVFFIDFEAFQDNDANYLIKEMCIMNVNNILEPFYYMFVMSEEIGSFSKSTQRTNDYLRRWRHHLLWNEGDCIFDANKVLKELQAIDNSLFYVNDELGGKKIYTVKKIFPNLRILNYNCSNINGKIPENISCPRYNHGECCAYKKCLKLCVHYLSSCQ